MCHPQPCPLPSGPKVRGECPALSFASPMPPRSPPNAHPQAQPPESLPKNGICTNLIFMVSGQGGMKGNVKKNILMYQKKLKEVLQGCEIALLSQFLFLVRVMVRLQHSGQCGQVLCNIILSIQGRFGFPWNGHWSYCPWPPTITKSLQGFCFQWIFLLPPLGPLCPLTPSKTVNEERKTCVVFFEDQTRTGSLNCICRWNKGLVNSGKRWLDTVRAARVNYPGKRIPDKDRFFSQSTLFKCTASFVGKSEVCRKG